MHRYIVLQNPPSNRSGKHSGMHEEHLPEAAVTLATRVRKAGIEIALVGRDGAVDYVL